jgi:prepilin-type N-terminal cleavage/methylation domain-containing protein
VRASASLLPVSRSRQRGFSMVELAITCAIILIITAFCTPTLLRTYKSYQLEAAGSQLVGVLNFTRSEAVRRNTTINCYMTPAGVYWSVWTDSNGNTVYDQGEKMFLTTNSGDLLPAASVPNPAALYAAAGIAAFTVLSGAAGNISYDSRGAVAPPSVYVMYIGNPSDATAGYLAVILRPSGIPQVWATTGNGNWRQIS